MASKLNTDPECPYCHASQSHMAFPEPRKAAERHLYTCELCGKLMTVLIVAHVSYSFSTHEAAQDEARFRYYSYTSAPESPNGRRMRVREYATEDQAFDAAYADQVNGADDFSMIETPDGRRYTSSYSVQEWYKAQSETLRWTH